MKEKRDSNTLLFAIVVIALSVVTVFSVSFAYFAFIAPNNVSATATAQFPEKTDKSSEVNTSGNCDLVVNYANMASGKANNTAPKFTSNCNINITVNGSPNDYCSYNIALISNGTGYSKNSNLTLANGTYEFSATITKNGQAFAGEAQIDTLATGTSLGGGVQTVTVGSGQSTKTDAYQLTLKYYNLNTDQTVGLTNTVQNFRYELKLLDVTCNFNH